MNARDEDVAVPLSVERVAEIAGRAAHLYEYGGDVAVDEWNALAGVDVPALVAEIDRLRAERHVTNEALDDAVRELRARRDDVTPQVTKLRALLAGQREAVEGEFHAALHHAYDKGREMPVPGACGACGSAPETWCPDCAACQKGCHGGFVNNPCTHPNAPWGGA